MHIYKKIFTVLAAVFVFAAAASADDEALKAFKSGDFKKGIDILKRSCEGKDAYNCGGLGSIYKNGYGVGQDYFKAAEFYEKACVKGDALSCNNLGYMYKNAQGVEQNLSKAAELYEKSCEGGIGCAALGLMYEFGAGAEKDQNKSLELYKKACDFGDQAGCENYERVKKQQA
ncbi:MAG: sel1 repeat family protein [Campylobacteraceae bacterium]|jgi:TPR repeat protein|nr:sel1 repeat family protein [Campylobacteraceae bacterium]